MERNTTTTMTTDEADAILGRFHADLSRAMILIYVYVAMVMVTGSLGNLLVVVVYGTKFKASTTRSFIMAVAVLDLVNCSLGMPLDLLILFTVSSDYTGIFCKIFGGTFVCTYFCSVLLLVGVASDRFRKICRPFASQLTVCGANGLIAGCGLITFVFAWPFILFYGERQEIVGGYNVTACDTENHFDDSPYPLIYIIVLFLVFLGGCVVLLTLYSLIILKIRNRQTTAQSSGSSVPNAVTSLAVLPASSVSADQSSPPARPTTHSFKHRDEQSSTISADEFPHSAITNGSSDEGTTDLSDNDFSNRKTTEHSHVSEVSSRNSISDVGEPASTVSQDSTTDDELSGNEDNHSRDTTDSAHRTTTTWMHKRDAAARRTTYTLFLVTLVYVLSFLPFLVRRTLAGLKITDDIGLWPSIILDLFGRSPYVQSAVNPFIYGARHPEFRERCKYLLDGLKWKATFFRRRKE